MNDDSIDIIALIKTVWTDKKLIVKAALISFVIGCLVAILSPVIYESQTTFVPQTSDQNSSNTKGYAQLASLAGINLNAESLSSLDNYLSPLLYSKIIESDEFSLNLLNEELTFLDGNKLTIKNYLLLDSPNFNIDIIGVCDEKLEADRDPTYDESTDPNAPANTKSQTTEI